MFFFFLYSILNSSSNSLLIFVMSFYLKYRAVEVLSNLLLEHRHFVVNYLRYVFASWQVQIHQNLWRIQSVTCVFAGYFLPSNTFAFKVDSIFWEYLIYRWFNLVAFLREWTVDAVRIVACHVDASRIVLVIGMWRIIKMHQSYIFCRIVTGSLLSVQKVASLFEITFFTSWVCKRT